MFVVTDNGNPACNDGSNKHKHEQLAAAREYAKNWLGGFAVFTPLVLEVNQPYDYNGYGDLIEIREEM